VSGSFVAHAEVHDGCHGILFRQAQPACRPQTECIGLELLAVCQRRCLTAQGFCHAIGLLLRHGAGLPLPTDLHHLAPVAEHHVPGFVRQHEQTLAFREIGEGFIRDHDVTVQCLGSDLATDDPHHDRRRDPQASLQQVEAVAHRSCVQAAAVGQVHRVEPHLLRVAQHRDDARRGDGVGFNVVTACRAACQGQEDRQQPSHGAFPKNRPDSGTASIGVRQQMHQDGWSLLQPQDFELLGHGLEGAGSRRHLHQRFGIGVE
jgi:hypothetical protein